MRDLVVEKALFLKREKRRFIAAHPEVCERCGSRHATPVSLQRHKREKHAIDALGSLFGGPKKK